MNENKKLTFLPVGSVVRLKGGERNVIIIGYTPIEAGKTEMWDYLGGMWPTGVITSDRNLLFNSDQIEEVIFVDGKFNVCTGNIMAVSGCDFNLEVFSSCIIN